MKHIKLQLETNNTKPFEETIEESVQSVLVNGVKGFEISNEDILGLFFSRWEVIIVPLNENLDELKTFIVAVCDNLDANILLYELIEDNTDYLNQEEHRYSLDMGNFVIFNNEEDFVKFYSPKKIPLLVKQSTGFGTGKHETTAMCIEALSDLYHDGYSFNNMLDLGTGSGILAIVMQKVFKGYILSTDIDELAISAAKECIVKNNSQDRITTLVSIGFDEIQPQKFDLITANILLNTLLNMVNSFYEYLSEDGYLILSGFLDNQVDDIINAFIARGFKLMEVKEKKDWRAVIFTK